MLRITKETAMEFSFKGSSDSYVDTKTGISLYTMSLANRRRLDTPTAASDRGIYFFGTGYLKTQNTIIPVFSPNFSFSLWIRPGLPTGSLLYKGSTTYSLFSISIESLTLKYSITLKDSSFTFFSISPIILSAWNHLFFTLSYTSASLHRTIPQ